MSENDKLAALLGSAYLLKKADDKIDSLERKISDVNNTVKSLIKDNFPALIFTVFLILFLFYLFIRTLKRKLRGFYESALRQKMVYSTN